MKVQPYRTSKVQTSSFGAPGNSKPESSPDQFTPGEAPASATKTLKGDRWITKCSAAVGLLPGLALSGNAWLTGGTALFVSLGVTGLASWKLWSALHSASIDHPEEIVQLTFLPTWVATCYGLIVASDSIGSPLVGLGVGLATSVLVANKLRPWTSPEKVS